LVPPLTVVIYPDAYTEPPFEIVSPSSNPLVVIDLEDATLPSLFKTTNKGMLLGLKYSPAT
jgi:hypothetical protein